MMVISNSCIAKSCDGMDAEIQFPETRKGQNRWIRNLGLTGSGKIERRSNKIYLSKSNKLAKICWRHFPEGSLRRSSINQYSFAYETLDGQELVPNVSALEAKYQKHKIIQTLITKSEQTLIEKSQKKRIEKSRARSFRYRRAKKQRLLLSHSETVSTENTALEEDFLPEDASQPDPDPDPDPEDELTPSKKNEIDSAFFRRVLGGPLFSWNNFLLADDRMIAHFTSFPSKQALIEFYNLLNFNNNLMDWDKKKPSLKSEDCLLLILISLKRGYTMTDLSFFFGVPRNTLSRTYATWLQRISAFLEVISPTPAKDILVSLQDKQNGGHSHFSSSHIIDTSAVQIETPSMLSRQSATYSTCYHSNCAKFLVCLSSTGYISYISRAYPGRISDTKICSQGFFQFLGDTYPEASVLADRGFFIHFSLAKEGATLLLPAHVSSDAEFTEDQISHTKKIANERIFIEHVVGAMKSFKILSRKIPIPQVDQIDLVLHIICNLLNFVHAPFVPQNSQLEIDSEYPCSHELVNRPELWLASEPDTVSSSAQ